MNKKNSVSKASIAFYVVSVLFLFVFAFNIYYSYQYLAQYELDFATQWKDILGTYFGQCTPSLGFAIMTYGIGFLIEKMNGVQCTLSACLEDVVQPVVKEEEKESDDFLAELKAEAVKKPKKAKATKIEEVKEEVVEVKKEEVVEEIVEEAKEETAKETK